MNEITTFNLCWAKDMRDEIESLKKQRAELLEALKDQIAWINTLSISQDEIEYQIEILSEAIANAEGRV